MGKVVRRDTTETGDFQVTEGLFIILQGSAGNIGGAAVLLTAGRRSRFSPGLSPLIVYDVTHSQSSHASENQETFLSSNTARD